jgi:hypothetical protein
MPSASSGTACRSAPAAWKDLQRADVRRVLHHDGVTGVDDGAGEQVERLLGTAGHDDLRRGDRPAHPGGLVRRDDLAQVREAGGLPVLHRRGRSERPLGGDGDALAGQRVSRGQAAGEAEDVGTGGQGEQVADRGAADVAQAGGERESAQAGGHRCLEGSTERDASWVDRAAGGGGCADTRMPY